MKSSSKRRRFVVMPAKGISHPTMQASNWSSGHENLLSQVIQAESASFRSLVPDTKSVAGAALTDSLKDEDFNFVSQQFEDGCATVAMTEGAKLAFQASHPELRILPLTKYHLPGQQETKRKGKVITAALTAATNAANQGGEVYSNDLKGRFLGDSTLGTDGQGVLVGVLDTGVDHTHPALQNKVPTLRCFVPGDATTAGGPVNWGAQEAASAGHGTHVAGILAASEGFGGPTGVAPGSRIASYRIFPNNPSGKKQAENPVIIDSIRAAIDDGCHIVNMSIEGASLREDGVRSAISDAWENGVVCVAAAGNRFGRPVSYPAALPHCLAITAIGREGNFPDRDEFNNYVSDQRASSDPDLFLARFSNFGPQVNFAAPGHAIVSTFPDGEWWFDSGTSMAAPFVSGLLAKGLSRNPAIRDMFGDARRSALMVQLLTSEARLLGLPQISQEGHGLPAMP